jgi:hypothetical protein
MNSEPIRREDLEAQLLERVRSAMQQVLAGEVNRVCCLSCVNWKANAEFCNLFKARPPARIIALGCPEYMDNKGIPF